MLATPATVPPSAPSECCTQHSPQAVMALRKHWLVQLTAARPDWKVWLDVVPARCHTVLTVFNTPELFRSIVE
jgi:hypothetical protein